MMDAIQQDYNAHTDAASQQANQILFNLLKTDMQLGQAIQMTQFNMQQTSSLWGGSVQQPGASAKVATCIADMDGDGSSYSYQDFTALARLTGRSRELDSNDVAMMHQQIQSNLMNTMMGQMQSMLTQGLSKGLTGNASGQDSNDPFAKVMSGMNGGGTNMMNVMGMGGQ
jgi:hypothetical protein